jgi:hypothetical protein
VTCDRSVVFSMYVSVSSTYKTRGGSRGGGAHTARPPLKLGKNRFFGVKSWFFTWNTPKMLAPPSARRNFLKSAPLTWNPGSAPTYGIYISRSKLTKISINGISQKENWNDLSRQISFSTSTICHMRICQ